MCTVRVKITKSAIGLLNSKEFLHCLLGKENFLYLVTYYIFPSTFIEYGSYSGTDQIPFLALNRILFSTGGRNGFISDVDIFVDFVLTFFK